jgi:hypothetical protein
MASFDVLRQQRANRFHVIAFVSIHVLRDAPVLIQKARYFSESGFIPFVKHG